MNRNSVIENIRMACHCGDDLETACSSLGLDYDCVEYFLAALAV